MVQRSPYRSFRLIGCHLSDGTCVRDYLHILDLAGGHVLALEALSPESKIFASRTENFFKGYNLGKGKGMSVLQIIEAMRKATGFDYTYEIIGRRYVVFAAILSSPITDIRGIQTG